MEYRYPAIYKYIILFIILFLFFYQYKGISWKKYLILSLFITLLVILLDYIFINNNPSIFGSTETFDVDNLDAILEDDESNNK